MRRQDRTTHEILSFARYLNKVFDCRASSSALTDSRLDPDIPPSVVFLAVFHGFAFRLPSFQPLEAALAQPALQPWIGANRAFGDDVLRSSLSGFQREGWERCWSRSTGYSNPTRLSMQVVYRAVSLRRSTVWRGSPVTAVVATPASNAASRCAKPA